MNKFKHWLIENFLPVYAKQSILAENAKLQAEIAQLRAELTARDEYIAGLRDGIKSQRRIIINTGGGG